ncbi:MAG TPA: hypothetical protein VIV60_21410 [Polyangiaceae bacterium]
MLLLGVEVAGHCRNRVAGMDAGNSAEHVAAHSYEQDFENRPESVLSLVSALVDGVIGIAVD